MLIRKLKLAGFKSFVEPAELRIEPGLTGVVGPNGCGKSNLLEAIRWVMGENSPKSMRSGGMDDVIEDNLVLIDGDVELGKGVAIIATPGHTRGTLSYIFPVHDRGRALTIAYAGGTAFNFPREAENFAIYRDSQKKMGDAARAAGATVLMTNHTEFDRAYDRARLAQLPRAAGEKHPYETDQATVLRYFEMSGLCAEAQRLSMEPAN